MPSLSSTSTFMTLAAVTLLLFTPTTQAAYTLADDYSGDSFYSGFDFFSDKDPTEGFVSYLPEPDAISAGLVGYLPDTIFPGGSPNIPSVLVGVDYKTKIANGTAGAGRQSVRLEGKKGYDTGLFIADILHMPGSIDGSWPALWLLGKDREWPADGEIDLLEGVHTTPHNAVTLHTAEGCKIDDSSPDNEFTGEVVTPDCYVDAEGQPGNAGCSIHMPNVTGPTDPLANYGDTFNTNGGGVYAVEWTANGIKAWFFARSQLANDTEHPVLSSTPDPSKFGTPVASFKGECDYAEKFKQLRIIINITFCGAWAGAVWEEDGCAERTGVGSCDEYVSGNPEKFTQAYWEFRGLRVYQEGEGDDEGKEKVRRGVVREESVPGARHRAVRRQGESRADGVEFRG